MTDNSDTFKAGFVTVVGRPNVGKSTLLNRLVGMDLAVVSPKPQTTRSTIRGILTTGQAQIVFLDTAGLHTPRDELGRCMVAAAGQALADADIVYCMVECRRPDERCRDVVARALEPGKPVFLLINKVDAVQKERILPVIEAYCQVAAFEEIIPISASTGENIDRLLQCTVARLPVAPPYYSPDVVSDEIERTFIAEFIRGRVYANTGEEIPYSTAVVVDDMQERAGGGAYIRAGIIVERESQKGMLIGKQGRMIKKIGAEARTDIEAFLGYRVYLDLRIRVERLWRSSPGALRKLGYR